MAHVIERPDARCIVREEHELVTVGLLRPGGDLSFALRVHVVVLARNLVPALCDDSLGLGQRNARERRGRHLQLEAEQRLDLCTVLLLDRGEAHDHELFVQLHDVFVGVDPADLRVDAGELCRVAAGERRVGAERRADLEDLAEPGRLCHLFEKLGALREIGLGVEVFDLEQFGARLARARHQLRGVQLDEVVLDPVRAPGVLKGGLHAEDHGVLGNAKVEEAPVHALVDAGVVGDRCLGYGVGCDVQRFELDLDPAELDALVVLELAICREEAALAERRDLVGNGIRCRRSVFIEQAGVNQLHRARFVAEHDELHLLLIAHCLDPTRHAHSAVGCCG